jgi:hypothetical protein
MSTLNHKPYSFFYFCPSFITFFVLVFLIACPDKPGSGVVTINITGNVTDKTNGSPMANVEVQLTASFTKVLRTTETNEEGQYSISYYGKCNRGDPGTTLYVRVRSLEGYYPDLPASYILLCIKETQTFNFRLIPNPM